MTIDNHLPAFLYKFLIPADFINGKLYIYNFFNRNIVGPKGFFLSKEKKLSHTLQSCPSTQPAKFQKLKQFLAHQQRLSCCVKCAHHCTFHPPVLPWLGWENSGNPWEKGILAPSKFKTSSCIQGISEGVWGQDKEIQPRANKEYRDS